MKLHEFISKWICKNSIVRIWVPIEDGHKLIIGPCMEWEILKNENYNHFEVIGVTDIFCEEYREAINIVVKNNNIIIKNNGFIGDNYDYR